MVDQSLPVVVVGAGPIGLSAAANLLDRGLEPVVLEAGDRVADSVSRWGHVRLFSPWRYVIDPVSKKMLGQSWSSPDPETHPTGRDLVDRYLQPLAQVPEIAEAIRLGRRVVSVTRRGVDKTRTEGREGLPFELTVDTAAGQERILAQAVIDASGTWGQPNPLGAGGVLAVGEQQARDRIWYGIPDVLGKDRDRYARKRVVVVGSGHTAQNAVRDLAALARQAPGTAATWVVRREDPGHMFGGGRSDDLPARAKLGSDSRALVEAGEVEFVSGFGASEVVESGQLWLVSLGGRKIGPFDEIVAATGSRPDYALAREIRLDLDPIVESTSQLAPMIDPNLHSCGTVPPHGVEELTHPDVGYYAIGGKSYGRAPTFLLLTGYEQARSVVAEIAGHPEEARQVTLELPATGVCSTSLRSTTHRCCVPSPAEETAAFSC